MVNSMIFELKADKCIDNDKDIYNLNCNLLNELMFFFSVFFYFHFFFCSPLSNIG